MLIVYRLSSNDEFMQPTVTPLVDNGIDSLVAVITVVVLLLIVDTKKLPSNRTLPLNTPVYA